jgi:hypothetical protein
MMDGDNGNKDNETEINIGINYSESTVLALANRE